MKHQKIDLLALDLEAEAEARKAAKPDAKTIRAFMNRDDIAKLRAEARARYFAQRDALKFAWNEAAHKRGKTSEASTPGSFAPMEGGDAYKGSGNESVPKSPPGSLSEAQRKVEAQAAHYVLNNYEEAKKKYAALPDSEGGKVLNTDTARELFPAYNMARSMHAASVHEPASFFIKKLYAERLAEAPAEGELPVVLFTAGGAGAGKSYGLNNVMPEAKSQSQIVYDTNMAGAKSAISKIDQALAAGKNISIVYVARDVPDAFDGAVKRANGQEAKYGKGNGRTVPMGVFIDTHMGARETIAKVAKHYEGNPRVSVQYILNGKAPKATTLNELPDIPRGDYNAIHEKLKGILDQHKAEGRISETVYSGFKVGTGH